MRLDEKLGSIHDQQLERDIRASLREHGASSERILELQGFLQSLVVEASLAPEDKLRPFVMADLRARDDQDSAAIALGSGLE